MDPHSFHVVASLTRLSRNRGISAFLVIGTWLTVHGTFYRVVVNRARDLFTTGWTFVVERTW